MLEKYIIHESMTVSSTATKPETKKYKFGVQKLLKRYNSFCLHVTLIIYNLQKCQLLYFFFSHLSSVGYLEQCLWPLASSSVVSIAEKNSKPF